MSESAGGFAGLMQMCENGENKTSAAKAVMFSGVCGTAKAVP